MNPIIFKTVGVYKNKNLVGWKINLKILIIIINTIDLYIYKILFKHVNLNFNVSFSISFFFRLTQKLLLSQIK